MSPAMSTAPAPSGPAPSLAFLTRHQRDLDAYRTQVHSSAEARFGPSFFGVLDEWRPLGATPTIVDLGCGPATLLARLRARHPGARLIGVELHPALLEMAAPTAAAAGITLVPADLALPVPLPDASADLVLSTLSFHEVPHPPDLLANAARLLRPGGRLLLQDIVRHSLRDYLAGRPVTPDTLAHFREHTAFTPEDLAFLAEDAGLRVLEVLTRGGGRFATLVAERPATA